jgi:N-acyl-D-aspartate/D-glutamate deacylase
VLFDPATVTDTATFEAPHAYPAGIDAVIVNGRVAWDGANRERAGRVLRRGDTVGGDNGHHQVMR